MDGRTYDGYKTINHVHGTVHTYRAPYHTCLHSWVGAIRMGWYGTIYGLAVYVDMYVCGSRPAALPAGAEVRWFPRNSREFARNRWKRSRHRPHVPCSPASLFLVFIDVLRPPPTAQTEYTGCRERFVRRVFVFFLITTGTHHQDDDQSAYHSLYFELGRGLCAGCSPSEPHDEPSHGRRRNL